MPRANRFHIPGLVWHITQRCHDRQFLLKFSRDRARWRFWLYQARRRFGLCVLNYIVTSNHVHLLVRGDSNECIARSMQLIAARVAQEYNQRKGRSGAFWEDRYFATAIETDNHLRRCLVYIDLNMVRAGVVAHPALWPHSGYWEIQNPLPRYRVIDYRALCQLLGFGSLQELKATHQQWVEQEIGRGIQSREAMWSEAVAVGSVSFVDYIKSGLGTRAIYRKIVEANGGTWLIEDRSA